MHVLLTGAASRLGRAIAAGLDHGHMLRLMDQEPVPCGPRSTAMAGSVLSDDDVRRAVAGMDAIVHTARLPPAGRTDDLAGEQACLDLCTRGTYTLLRAAVGAGVRRFVYASTLALFDAYAEDRCITEEWQPLPGADTVPLARYLGELTCREFARDHRISVTCLRLGHLVSEAERGARDPGLMPLDPRDAGQAFHRALALNRSDCLHATDRYAVYHVCAAIPNPKYLLWQAKRIGYRPKHDFQAHAAQANDGT